MSFSLIVLAEKASVTHWASEAVGEASSAPGDVVEGLDKVGMLAPHHHRHLHVTQSSADSQNTTNKTNKYNLVNY